MTPIVGPSVIVVRRRGEIAVQENISLNWNSKKMIRRRGKKMS